MFQKDNSHIFDFSKAIPKRKEKKPTSKAWNLLSSFICLQLIFGAYNLYRAENFLQDRVAQSEQIGQDYNDLSSAIKKGDQNKVISLFGKIKNQNTPIADLLIGGNISLLHLPKDNTMPVEYTSKVTPETLETLDYIYKNNWNSGVLAETKFNNSINCFFGDFTCYIAKPFIKDFLQKNTNYINYKVIKNNYNMTHLDEYLDWHERITKQLNLKNITALEADPGTIYINTLK
jgi:hypothetical protein